MSQLDSEARLDGMFLDLLDKEWRNDKLPEDDVQVPLEELPEIELEDNGDTKESIKEQGKKWIDIDFQEFLKTLNQTKQS